MQKRQIQSEKQKYKNFILRLAYVEILSTRKVWRARKRRKSGFQLLRNFSVPTHVNIIDAMYGGPRVNLKVKRRSTLTCTRDLPYILFTRVKFTCAHREKSTRQWKTTFRVARGAAESNSSLLSVLQTSQVLNISTYAELKHELIVL